MRLSVRAPGKAIVCGEYAVLEGAPAISIAVDRYAIATLGDPDAKAGRTPFVVAALAHSARALSRPELADLAVRVDSSGLYEQGGKLGLGSSAAVTAAVVGLAFAHTGASLDDRARLFTVADAAHAEAQGVVGSGIDVATSVYGGAIEFERLPGQSPKISPVHWPSSLRISFVYSGTSASTPDLVGRVRRLRDRDAARYTSCMDALADIARSFALALRSGDASSAVAAAARWTPALDALGHAADAPIVTPFFDWLHRSASAHGAAAKPSGAGGGDLGVILATALGEPIDTLSRSLHHEGMNPLSLVPNGPAPGLALEMTS
jgi:phosphomevalonate kinase